jgi:glutamate/tyrosine decarboxylase-like PLP-dependent enzyme
MLFGMVARKVVDVLNLVLYSQLPTVVCGEESHFAVEKESQVVSLSLFYGLY